MPFYLEYLEHLGSFGGGGEAGILEDNSVLLFCVKYRISVYNNWKKMRLSP